MDDNEYEYEDDFDETKYYDSDYDEDYPHDESDEVEWYVKRSEEYD